MGGGWGRLRCARFFPGTRESGPPASPPSDPGVWTPSPSPPQPGVWTPRRSSPTQDCSPLRMPPQHPVLQLHVKKGAGLGQVGVGPGPEPRRLAAVASPFRPLSAPSVGHQSQPTPPHPPRLAKLRKHLWHGRAGRQSDRGGAQKSAGPPAAAPEGWGPGRGRTRPAPPRPPAAGARAGESALPSAAPGQGHPSLIL